MSERRPNDQPHRDRIEREFDRNLLVEAGAGSGKTHSLASRMAGGIAAGAYQIEHMAAVTFTRKAAAELRGRFQLALETRLRDLQGNASHPRRPADHESGAAEVDRLASALGNLERFFAGTIHAFCAHLLRERPVESRIAPGFTELDEAEDTRLREEAWRDYISAARGAGKAELLELIDAGVQAKDLDAAFRTVCLYEEVDFPAGDAARPDPRTAWQRAQVFWKALRALLPSPIEDDSKCKVIATAQQFERMCRVIDPSRPDSIVRALEVWQGSSLKVTYKWWDNRAKSERAAALLAAFQEDVVRPFLQAWRQYVYRLSMTVLMDARDHFARERRRHNTLNYADLLQMAARVLRENGEVRRALQWKYRWLFVDEFQDTDPVQAEIIALLAADGGEQRAVDWRQRPLRPGALFVVGDPKQSIYRFRRADIDIYSCVRDLIVRSGGDVVPLTANFRSVGAICRWANDVFEKRFPGSASRHAPAFEPLDAFRTDLDARKHGIRTLTISDKVSEKEVAEAEADAIARYIRSEVDRGRRYGDFLLLTRKKKPLATYARVLEGYRIPVEVSGAGAFGESEEVHSLAVLLRALADPQDSVALVGALRGPFFGISDPELFSYVHAGGRLWLFDGIDADVVSGLDPGIASEPDGQAVSGSGFVRVEPVPAAVPPPRQPGRVSDALTSLRRMFRWTRTLPAAAAVERILDHTGYLALAATTPGGAEAGDLLHAIDRIRQAAEHGGTLLDAVATLEEDEEASSELDSLPLEPGRSDVVRLMNLHKAKGLEADVVFLADPCGGFKSWPDVRIVREGGAAYGYLPIVVKFKKGGVRVLGEPAGWSEHKAAEQQYLDAEIDRLLYVAATRARDMLVVGRWANPRGRSVPAWNAFDPFLRRAEELRVPVRIAAVPDAEIDLSDAALAEYSSWLSESTLGARAPSWSVTSVTAEARHIAKVVRKVDGAPDDATRTLTGDTPAHRADAGMAWGTLIHGLLEHAMRHARATRDDLRRLAMWLTVEEPQLRAVIEEALDTVERATRFAFWAAARRRAHSVETPFTVADSNRLTAGIIDLIFESDDGWQVVDYKTDRSLKEARYTAQLEAYRTALRQVGCAVAGASLVNVRPEQT